MQNRAIAALLCDFGAVLRKSKGTNTYVARIGEKYHNYPKTYKTDDLFLKFSMIAISQRKKRENTENYNSIWVNGFKNWQRKNHRYKSDFKINISCKIHFSALYFVFYYILWKTSNWKRERESWYLFSISCRYKKPW